MSSKKNSIKLLLFFIVIFSIQTVVAEPLSTTISDFDQVLVNSQNWQDIYQGLLFAQLVDVPGDYIFSTELAQTVIESLPTDKKRVLLLQPSRQQQYAGTEKLLRNKEFTVIELPGAGRIGLRLADSLAMNKIIITDERYPYNAISLAPYAIQQQAFVIFADATTLDETITLLEEKNVPLITYGLLDTTVQTRLARYTPEIINEGGKFDNNIYVVKKFLEENPTKQVIITNGEFIEEGLIDDFNPVLFIGKTNIPKQVENYVATAPIESGVVVGNYLSDLVSQFKQTLQKKYDKEIYFVVKFAKTPRVQTEQFSTPVTLEYFALPIHEPALKIVSLIYNRLTKQLELTLENPAIIPTFSYASLSLQSENDQLTIGDEEPQIIAAGQQKTFIYDVGLLTGELSGNAFMLYGDYENSLEYSLSGDFATISVIDLADNSQLEILALVYDTMDEAFYITLANPSKVTTYVNLELVDVIVDGMLTTLGTPRIASLAPGEQKTVYVRATLSKLDIVENEQIRVKGYYGQRENVLLNVEEQTFEMKVRYIKGLYILVGVAIILFLLLLLFFFNNKKTYVCDRCNNSTKAKKNPGRHVCGGTYKKH